VREEIAGVQEKQSAAKYIFKIEPQQNGKLWDTIYFLDHKFQLAIIYMKWKLSRIKIPVHSKGFSPDIS
jgi:hypothetical protein